MEPDPNQQNNFFRFFDDSNYQNYEPLNSQYFPPPPQNPEFLPPNSQQYNPYPHFPRQNYPPQTSQYSQPLLISDHESGTRAETLSSNSLGRTGLENINLNASNDDEDVQIIEGGAGKITKTKWTRSEDLALISAWLSTSNDPVIGINQSSLSFWKQIAQKVSNNTTNQRNASQCKSHWGKTVQKVTKFYGCYRRARDLCRSGWSDMNYMEEAEKILESENAGKSFTYKYWWEQLKYEVKWNDMYMQDYGSKRTKVSETGAYTTSSGGNDSVNISRPIGQKAAKKNKGKGKGNMNDGEQFSRDIMDLESRKMLAMEKLADTQAAMAEAKVKKAEALRAQAEAQKFSSALEVLNKDTSNMSDEQRVKHEQLCDILRAQIFGM